MRSGFTHAVRGLLRQPTFAATALATLALGVGANTAIFSIVYGVLMRPLPYADPDRIVRVSESHPGANSPLMAAMLSDLTLQAWAPSARTLADLSAVSSRVYTIGAENPVRVQGAAVSPSLFEALRVKPEAGRFFDPSHTVEGAQHVIVLGDGFWNERFGRSASAIGQTLLVNGRPHEILGVAPRGFAFPDPEA